MSTGFALPNGLLFYFAGASAPSEVTYPSPCAGFGGVLVDEDVFVLDAVASLRLHSNASLFRHSSRKWMVVSASTWSLWQLGKLI